jgi:hypothetical protein
LPGSLKTVDIKYDMPDVKLAVRRVTYNIRNGQILGMAAIKFIHGYGSSGKGGRIRVEARRYLGEQKRMRRIRDFIIGEDFSIFDEPTRAAFAVCDELRRDPDLDRHNNGVTIVIL